MKRHLTGIVFLAFLSLYFVYHPIQVFADTSCDPSSCPSDPDQGLSCLNQVTKKCEADIQNAKNQEKTLSSQLSIIDGQTKITKLKIEETNLKIQKLRREIEDLSTRIDRISSTVDTLSQVLLNRIVQTYKYGSLTTIDLLFSSHGFADLVEKLKYIQVAQANDKKVLYQLQATKAAYHDQKQDKQVRQQEAEKLSKDLASYQTQLVEQKKAKDQLLAQTQNSETNYQKMLVQARAQLSAFQGFVRSQGGLTLIAADPSWPAGYFSQRDNRWGSVAIGTSPYSIGLAGCLVSSVAMTLTHQGNSQTPLTIGTNSSYFFEGDFLWSGLTSLGFNSPSRTTNTLAIDNALNAGKWAIAGISYSQSASSEPFHFVVITSKNGSDYNLFDPWKGPNISFNSNYLGNYITEIITY